jgi:hypothetical protein
MPSELAREDEAVDKVSTEQPTVNAEHEDNLEALRFELSKRPVARCGYE